ncbi:hypothetical protein [Thermoflavimicrobium daqui]|uniref:hypothetical protein n=1 Tax=Thermoflavimicrobium daqui TaxID=2137476 RepID=UPI001F0BA6CB|nr:hypothetical protein [Thermoflavimicrobium daqui]
MLKMKYWKVVCRYGHVGKRKDVSVARYLKTNANLDIYEVMLIASTMPGVKCRGILEVTPISKATYQSGKESEKENLYLKKLMSFKPKQEGKKEVAS